MRPFLAALITTVALSSSSIALASESSSSLPGPAAANIVAQPTISTASPELSEVSALNTARLAAVSDALSTHLAIAAGAVESNGLVTATPAGLLALTAIKLGVLQFANYMPKEVREPALKASTALWGGAAVNNILVAASVGGAAPIVVGIAAGYWLWKHEAKLLEREEAKRKKASETPALVTP